MRLRVLMTTDAVGGVWTYAVDLAASLCAEGAEVILAAMGPAPTADQRREAGAIAGLSLIETGLPLDWMAADPGAVQSAAADFHRLAARLAPDIIHLNSPTLAIGGPFGAPVLGVCHSCLATWWAAVKPGSMPADFAWRTDLLRRGLHACDQLAAPSRSFAQATATAYAVPAPVVIHNGRRPPLKAADPALREPLAFTTGRLWDEGKNAAVLDVAAGLCGTRVVAAGPLAPPGGDLSIDLHHIRSLGRLDADEVAAWLRRATVFVSSALYEPFGLGVLEAAQAGCALVLSDIPTFRELWEDAALFADPADPMAFARHINAVTTDGREAQRLGALAEARAERFAMQAAASRTLDLYRSLLPVREAA